MNKAKIIQLLEDGAYFDSNVSQFVHPSFRKGWRKMTWTDISWQAVVSAHGTFGSGRLFRKNQIFMFAEAV